MLRDRLFMRVPLRAALISLSTTAACGPQVVSVVDSDTDDAATTTGLASGDSTTADTTADETGDAPVPPMADCEGSPLDLAAPQWEWNATPEQPSAPFEQFVVLPGGDVLWLEGHTRIGRWTAGGELVWDLEAGADEVWSLVKATPFGEPVVLGHVGDAMAEPAQLQLLRLSAAGDRLDERLYDDAPGTGQVPSDISVAATGDLFVRVFWLEDESWRLQRYDASFERMWSLELELEPGRVVLAMGTDAGAALYVASVRLHPEQTRGYRWEGRLDDYDPDGMLRGSEEFELLLDNLPQGELAVSDRVYLLASGLGSSPSVLLAWDLDGSPAFSLSSADTDPYRVMHSLAASPCGGVYVGGRATVEDVGIRAALWHVDAQGVEGPPTVLVEDAPFDGRWYDSVDRIRVSALDEVVVRGELGPMIEDMVRPSWMRGY